MNTIWGLWRGTGSNKYSHGHWGWHPIDTPANESPLPRTSGLLLGLLCWITESMVKGLGCMGVYPMPSSAWNLVFSISSQCVLHGGRHVVQHSAPPTLSLPLCLCLTFSWSLYKNFNRFQMNVGSGMMVGRWTHCGIKSVNKCSV